MYSHILGQCLLRRRADHIVRFVAVQRQHRDVERIDHLHDARNLPLQIEGHLVACAFVFLVNRVASAESHVETHGQVLRLVFFQNIQQQTDKPVGCVGRFAIACRKTFNR